MFMGKNNDYSIPVHGINTIEKLEIGGVMQSILIQSHNPANPVLLFIHGGPSMPVPGVSCRGTDYALITCTKELVKHFTVVYWDQRGTGKSYSKHIPKQTMHLEQFIRDAAQLSDQLRSRFGQPRIHLAAHSWGSVIGLPLIHRHPEKFHSYTAFSQITNWVENDKLCYNWLLDKAKRTDHSGMLKELSEVGEPPYLESFKQWSVIRKWLIRNNSMFHDAGDNNSATFYKTLRIMLKSPDYSLKDVFQSFVSGFKLAYTDEMLRDLNSFDFFSEVRRVEVPVVFIHGSQEKHVMPELAFRYFENLEAPYGKKFFWAPKSSHAFHPDDAKANERILIEHVLHGSALRSTAI
ncbi:alpha/beta hydrolase [Paenibacillus mesophilus]|nr:alpha/beta hydrolase [Paenibacillus mesophilus]